MALGSWAKVWGFFGVVFLCLGVGFFEESGVPWCFFQLEDFLYLCNFLCYVSTNVQDKIK